MFVDDALEFGESLVEELTVAAGGETGDDEFGPGGLSAVDQVPRCQVAGLAKIACIELAAGALEAFSGFHDRKVMLKARAWAKSGGSISVP
jgi:hypothetical protein